MRSIDLVILAVVHDIADATGVGINAALLVGQHRVVGPGVFPQLVTHSTVFIGHRIAHIVIWQARQAIAAAGAFEIGGHDIPRHTPLGQMIERGNEACESERVMLQDGAGEAETKMLGDRRHGGNQ